MIGAHALFILVNFGPGLSLILSKAEPFGACNLELIGVIIIESGLLCHVAVFNIDAF